MSKVTTHRRRAERFTAASPASVFAVAADLDRFPEWWFTRDPEQLDVDRALPRSVRHVDQVDGGSTTASPGTAVDIRSDVLEGKLLGRTITIRPASILRVTCEAADPDVRLVLAHPAPDGEVDAGKPNADVVRTGLTIEPEGDGSRVVLTQESEVHGRGLFVAAVRKVHEHADGDAEKTLGRLLEIAETDVSVS